MKVQVVVFTQYVEGAMNGVRIGTIFQYRTDNPLAVGLHFPAAPESDWTFARSLMHETLADDSPAGVGDVVVLAKRKKFFISFMGDCTIEFKRADIQDFFDTTIKMVRMGDEIVDLEAEFLAWQQNA